MANSQNLCLFTGNLGKDPEIRYSQSGAAVANLSIALSSRRKMANNTKTTPNGSILLRSGSVQK